MSIKSQGGVFGRNPTFNDVTVEGDLSIAGTLSVGGETITGLSYQGGWNADTNTPDIAASSPVTGQFWIVSTDGSTDVGGITNWTSGDWALYDGTNWQRVEGGNTDLTTGVSGQLAVANGGTGAADAATARTNLGLGTAATTAATDYATSAQGSLADSAIQPADLGTAAYTASTDYATAAQGSTADSALQPADIGSTVQGYDADTAKYDAATAAFTGNLSVASSVLYVDSSLGRSGIGTASPQKKIDIRGNSGASTDNVTLRITCGDTSAILNQVTGRIENYTSDADGPHVASYIETISNDSYGRQSSLSFGVSQSNNADATEAFRIDNTGDATVSNGNLVIGTSGKGIDFSATAGTGTSELFDDYEEGTWTPTYLGSTTDPTSVNYTSINAGTYVKAGRQVTVQCTLGVTTFTAGTGDLRIGGLPFSAASSPRHNVGSAIVRYINWDSSTYEYLICYIHQSENFIRLYQCGDNTDFVPVPVTAWTSGGTSKYIATTITYFV